MVLKLQPYRDLEHPRDRETVGVANDAAVVCRPVAGMDTVRVPAHGRRSRHLEVQGGLEASRDHRA